jgi:hypothetical protein
MRLLSRLLIVLVFCLVAITLPAAPAQAVGAQINLSPTSGVPGDNVRVYGSNFTPGKYVDIYYDGSLLDLYIGGTYTDSAKADGSGNFQVDFKVPPSYKGPHSVLARDEADKSASAEFTVKPVLIVDPKKGPVGTNVTVEGQGFGKDEADIQVRYYLGSDYDTVLQNIEADENGSWEKTFVIPSSARGDHRIDAAGKTSTLSAVKDATFEVTPTISLVDSSGSPGQNITMTGKGFYAGDRYIKILFEGEEAETEIIRADDNGYWQGNFTVPEMPIGTYNVTAEGDLTPEEDINTLSFEIKPGLVLSPNAGHVGTDLTVTGSGFPINEDVNIMYEGSLIETAQTNNDGTFEAGFIVPESLYGTRQVTAEDATGNNASAIFTMESTPPGTPELISPPDGSRVGSVVSVRPTFEWSAVPPDPSGVYYSLQIAASDNVTIAGNFTDPLVSVQNIVGTNYTLNATEALSYGTYYWIVQAVDGAGNAGNWTAARSFQAGFLPLWAFILGIIVAVGLIGTLVYYFVIRRRIYYL